MNDLQYLTQLSIQVANILNINAPHLVLTEDSDINKLIEKHEDHYTINLPANMTKETLISLVIRGTRLVWSDIHGLPAEIFDAICFEVGFKTYIFHEEVETFFSGITFLDDAVRQYIAFTKTWVGLFGTTLGPRNSWINEVNRIQQHTISPLSPIHNN